LHHIFVGKDLSGVFNGLFDGQGSQALRVNLGILIHKTMKMVLIHKRRHCLAGLVGTPGPERTAVKDKEGVIEAVTDSLTAGSTEDKAFSGKCVQLRVRRHINILDKEV
ncbi:unnamed protein product, partial [marine sediment metagenome]